ncbi:hypothetical protein DFH28DRAFT_1091462 [Melampsora americana]|nr:hypothetical protein DFH28DRAFT_1091462 [Melampsora americana]
MRSISIFLLFSVNLVIPTQMVLSAPQSAFTKSRQELHTLSTRGYFDAESTAKEIMEANKLLRPPKRLPGVNTIEKSQSLDIQKGGKPLNAETLSTIPNPESTDNSKSFLNKGHERMNSKTSVDAGTLVDTGPKTLGYGKAELSTKVPSRQKPTFFKSFFQPSRVSSEEKSMKYCFPITKDACAFTGVFSGFKKFASKSNKWLRSKSSKSERVGLLSPLPKRQGSPLETPPEDGPYYSSAMLALSSNQFQRLKTM